MVLVTPWWNRTDRPAVSSPEVVTLVTETYFEVSSFNADEAYFLNWLAVADSERPLVVPRDFHAHHLGQAIDQLKDWFPEHGADFEKHRGHLEDVILRGAMPDSALLDIPLRIPDSRVRSEPSARSASDCDWAIAMTVIDVVTLILALVGVYVKLRADDIAPVLLAAGEEFTQLQRLAEELVDDTRSSMHRAFTAMQILSVAWKIAGKDIVAVIRQQSDWLSWALTAATLTAQVILLASTDGASIYPQVALLLLGGGSLGLDMANLRKSCGVGAPQ